MDLLGILKYFYSLFEPTIKNYIYKITDKPIPKIINNQLEQFTEEDLIAVLKKPAGFDKITPRSQVKLDDILLRLGNTMYKKKTKIEKWKKGSIRSFPKKVNLRITKNYREHNYYSYSCKSYTFLIISNLK